MRRERDRGRGADDGVTGLDVAGGDDHGSRTAGLRSRSRPDCATREAGEAAPSRRHTDPGMPGPRARRTTRVSPGRRVRSGRQSRRHRRSCPCQSAPTVPNGWRCRACRPRHRDRRPHPARVDPRQISDGTGHLPHPSPPVAIRQGRFHLHVGDETPPRSIPSARANYEGLPGPQLPMHEQHVADGERRAPHGVGQQRGDSASSSATPATNARASASMMIASPETGSWW